MSKKPENFEDFFWFTAAEIEYFERQVSMLYEKYYNYLDILRTQDPQYPDYFAKDIRTESEIYEDANFKIITSKPLEDEYEQLMDANDASNARRSWHFPENQNGRKQSRSIDRS